jgi:hypothetical protein
MMNDNTGEFTPSVSRGYSTILQIILEVSLLTLLIFGNDQ